MSHRIYLSYSSRDSSIPLDVLRAALTRAGYDPLGLQVRADPSAKTALRNMLRGTDAVIVFVGHAALDSPSLKREVAELLALPPDQRPPVLPFLDDFIAPDDLRTNGLDELADLSPSTAPGLHDRVAETIESLDTALPGPPRVVGPSALTALRTIDAGAPVEALAVGEVAGNPVLVTGGLDGSVRLWDLRRPGGDPRVLSGHRGPVWSVAVGTVGGEPAIVSGGQDHTVRTWHAVTGEPRLLFEEHTGPVNTVAVGIVGDRAVVMSGSDDGTARLWETELAPLAHPAPVRAVAFDASSDGVFTGCKDGRSRLWYRGSEHVTPGAHADAVTTIAFLRDLVASGGMDGSLCVWNADTEDVQQLAAHPGGVRVAVGGGGGSLPDLISCGEDGLVRLWNLETGGSTPLAGHNGPVTGVAVGTIQGERVVVSSGFDGTVRIWGHAVPDYVDWLPDAPSRRDLLHRRPLAHAIATRLRRTNNEDPGTSFLIHVDGPWGTGKSTLLHFLDEELRPDFDTVRFDAWREAEIGPAWWALLTALRASVRRQRRWLGRCWLVVAEGAARVRRVGAPFLLAVAVLVVLAAGILWAFTPVSPAGLKDTAAVVTGVLTAVGTLWAGSLVASRFLLWDSARGARVFEQSGTNPMREVTRHFGWLLGASRKPVVFLVDDLDRCSDAYVVELLESVQTLVRDSGPPSAHFIVAADGAWLRTSYEERYATFAGAVAAPGQPIGYLFLDKFFQLRVPVPTIDAIRQQHYLHALLLGDHRHPVALADEESRVRAELAGSVTEAQVIETLRGVDPNIVDRVVEAAVDKLTTPEVVEATEHSLQRFARLLPPNPRAMKRFVNTYSAMRAVRTLEGNTVPIEALAVWTIIEIRWPSLADHLRARPESITLVGRLDADEVPEALQPLFTDPVSAIMKFPTRVGFAIT